MLLLRRSLIGITVAAAAVVLLFLIFIRRQTSVTPAVNFRQLYSFASGGDLKAVKSLAESSSPEAARLLKKLAQDQGATSDSRVAAIDALAQRSPQDEAGLAPLLDISQPYDVRINVIRVFKQHGCGHDCISATLLAEFALRTGAPTLESSETPAEVERRFGVHLDPKLDAELKANLRYETEQGFLSLLRSNPCAAQTAAKKDFSSSPQYVAYIQSVLPPC